MQKRILNIIALLIALLFSGSANAGEQLVIEGTGDSQRLLRHLATAFESVNPGARVTIPESIGSSGGVKALLMGKADMARVARPLKDTEKALAADLVYREFAYSPVVFAANLPGKCIENLTTDQVVGIFSGEISDWSGLGHCPERKIYVAMREAGDSSRSVLEKKIHEFKGIRKFAGKVIYSTPKTLETLEDHPFTIGFLPRPSVSKKILIFSYNGIAPDDVSIRNGSYPLTCPLGLVWRGELSDLGSRFIAYISSPEGEKIIRSAGTVPVPGLQ